MVEGLILDQLQHVSGGRARLADDTDRIAGVAAKYVARPASTDEVAAVLRVAASSALRLVVRGGGSKLDWGMPPRSVDLILDTGEISGIVEHASGDLVVVARAGTTYDDLQSAVGVAAQRLALDSALPGATLGGIVATNSSGPRRLLHGTMRDLLIGVTFVRADGVVAKAGGKVVKNVAGYDFGKLLTGSYGTLAVITQVALRLHPRPAAASWITAALTSPEQVSSAIDAISESTAVPTAMEVDAPGGGPISITVLLEGTAGGVAARAQTVAALFGHADVADRPRQWFGQYPFASGRIGLKITSVISGAAALLSGARELSDRYGVAIDVRGSASGVWYAGFDAEGSTDVRGVVQDLRTVATAQEGSLVVLTAPPEVRAELDVWGPVRGLVLMHRVKHEFDPGHRLAPGRFVGGI